MTERTVSGAGLRRMPSRSPATALKLPQKYSAARSCTAASGLLETMARWTPSWLRMRTSSGMPG